MNSSFYSLLPNENIKTCIDRMLDVKAQPWLMDEIKLIQAPEEKVT